MNRLTYFGLSCCLLVGCAGGSIPLGSIGSSLTGFNIGDSELDAFRSIGRASEKIGPQEEYYIGRAVAANILYKYPVSRNGNLQRYVNKVGQSLVAFSDRPETYGGYHFAVVQSPEINAVAAPGGYIFITDSFLKQLRSEDELAAVLAHEVGHVVEEHGVSAISQAHLTNAFMKVGSIAADQSLSGTMVGTVGSPLVEAFQGSVDDVLETLLVNGYGRSQEYDADEYGVQLLAKAGYDPNAFVSVLKTLERLEKESTQGGWLSTHPKGEDRLDELDDLPRSRSTDLGLAARTRRFSAATGIRVASLLLQLGNVFHFERAQS
ncbi:MAG: M48 family metalloprotease [Bdellovibrionales bacterium]|nr:M48 family metalloprotease [Bdellovibrionales bacterium]